MLITGTVRDRDNSPVAGADVMVLNDAYEVLAQTLTDERGVYALHLELEIVPRLVATKGYGETGLEFWGSHLRADERGTVMCDAEIDTLEVYRLHAFAVEQGLMIFFRPMELHRARPGVGLPLDQMAPDIDWQRTQVTVDGLTQQIVAHQEIREHVGQDAHMVAQLVQTLGALDPGERVLRVHLVDTEGHVGEALHGFTV